MENSHNVLNDGMKSTIEPYYVRGDVFQRDRRYYDQLLENRRVRSSNKRYYDSRNRSRDRFDGSRITHHEHGHSHGHAHGQSNY